MSDLKEERLERNKLFREMDITISQYLFNRPCVMWWEVTNHDGDDMINYFNDKIVLDGSLEPLFELKPGDWDYHEISDKHKEDEKKYDTKKENWKNGIHRWNLQKIPYYHKDLNLLRECEDKIVELNLADKYINNLKQLVKLAPNPPDISLETMKLLQISAEGKAMCIAALLREHFNVKSNSSKEPSL